MLEGLNPLHRNHSGMADNKDSIWQSLEWARKVELCEQGRANEDNLLHSYIITFIALETVLFAAVFSVAWSILWAVLLVSPLGLFLAFLWMHVNELRGNAVDRWTAILAGLWAQVDAPKVIELEKGILEFAEHYKGGIERREKRRKSGRKAVFLGWGWFGSYKGSEERRRGKFGWLYSFLRREKRLGPLRSARWVLTVFIPLLVVIGWILVIVVTIVGAF